jgi:hypothetical protein
MAKNRAKEQLLRDYKKNIRSKVLFTNEELNAITGRSKTFWKKEKEAGRIKVFAHPNLKDTQVSIWSLRDYIKNNETFLSRSQQ